MSDFVVSARKYRPQSFDQVVGQRSITLTLSNAIKDNYLAQSFLFCGPRGVGKTTCARILAKTINCHDIGVNTNACNTCESCTSFNQNSSFNIHEIDAASNNSVDDIRNLIDQVRLAPQVGKYNIYIIDEVHMLSTSAFNAFLKTLEEPPPHAIFILATTEKNKIIPTILSRCQIFDFKNISISDIISHLEHVAELEGVSSEKEAFNIIAHKSGGSLRDALSMFDRLVNSTNLTLTYQDVITNLNILDYDYYLRMTDYLLDHDISAVMLTINEILDNGFDGHEFIMGLANHFRDVLVCKNQETIDLLDKEDDVKQKYLLQSERCELSFLIRSLRICNKCDVDYRLSKDQKLLVELTLLKIASIGESSIEKKKLIPFKTENRQEVQYPTPNIKDPKKIDVELDHKVSDVNESMDSNKQRRSSFSITDILKDDIETGEEVLLNRSKTFNEEDMLDYWMQYANKIKEEGKTNLYITLTSFSPKLVDNNVILLKISNDAQEKILREHELTLLDSLRGNLENDSISLEIEIVDELKIEVAYTSQEKLEKMIQMNPAVGILKEELNLDIN